MFIQMLNLCLEDTLSKAKYKVAYKMKVKALKDTMIIGNYSNENIVMYHLEKMILM